MIADIITQQAAHIEQEIRFLIHALAESPFLCDEDAQTIECLFCFNEMPEGTQMSDFIHVDTCPMLRAQQWMSRYTVVESTIIEEQRPC